MRFLKNNLIIFAYVSLLSINTNAILGVENDLKAEIDQFSKAKHLQLGKFKIPKALTSIDDQIKENIVDVIILSETHTPVWATERDDGYSDKYKNFYGLDFEIIETKKSDDFFLLSVFYYNWTTKKFDKRFVKKINKYNVLNDTRFLMLELFKGKDFVKKNKEAIERENYERISKIKKGLDEKKAIKKKSADEKLKKKIEQEEEEERKAVRRLKRAEDDKKFATTIERNSRESEEEQTQTQSQEEVPTANATEDEPMKEKVSLTANKTERKSKQSTKKIISKKTSTPTPSTTNDEIEKKPEPENVPEKPNITPTDFDIALKGGLHGEYIQTSDIIFSTSNLRYMLFGVNFNYHWLGKIPFSLYSSASFGPPIFKEKYTFPMYRIINAELRKNNLIGHFGILGGLDFRPLYFVNIPTFGGTLKVYETDVIWAKMGLTFNYILKGHELEFVLSSQSSLMMANSQQKSFDLNMKKINISVGVFGNHHLEFTGHQTTLTGQVAGSTKSYYIGYIYKMPK